MRVDGGGNGVTEFGGRSIMSELKHMKDRVDSLISEVFSVGSPSDNEKSDEPMSEWWEPQTDIGETPHGWFLVADLPGVLEENLKVEMVENRITIEGKRESLASTKDLKMYQTERSYGIFRRSFDLPPNMKKESITAELKNGVLSISIMKDDQAPERPFKVAVKSC